MSAIFEQCREFSSYLSKCLFPFSFCSIYFVDTPMLVFPDAMVSVNLLTMVEVHLIRIRAEYLLDGLEHKIYIGNAYVCFNSYVSRGVSVVGIVWSLFIALTLLFVQAIDGSINQPSY